jgi:hypothetical protein
MVCSRRLVKSTLEDRYGTAGADNDTMSVCLCRTRLPNALFVFSFRLLQLIGGSL